MTDSSSTSTSGAMSRKLRGRVLPWFVTWSNRNVAGAICEGGRRVARSKRAIRSAGLCLSTPGVARGVAFSDGLKDRQASHLQFESPPPGRKSHDLNAFAGL